MYDKLGQNRFLVLGRAGLDLYADPPGARAEESTRFTSALGGSAANIAVGIVKLGGAASLVTVVSDDAVGRFVLRELGQYGVGCRHVRSASGECRTSLAVVETRLENCQSVIYRNGAADFALATEDIDNIELADHAALIVTGTALAVEPSRSATLLAMARARAADVPVILDVDYRPYSWASADDASRICLAAAQQSDMVIGNDAEFAVMAGGDGGIPLAADLAAGCQAVIYKMGEAGSVTFTGGGRFDLPAYRVEAMKPTGAGDAFMAGLMTGLSAGCDLMASVRRGSAAAAIVVTRVGCAPASPTQDELDDFMRSRLHSA